MLNFVKTAYKKTTNNELRLYNSFSMSKRAAYKNNPKKRQHHCLFKAARKT